MKNKIKTYQDLIVWQKAHLLVIEIYKSTRSYPADEKFTLVSQTRRAASSVAANIVEGFARHSIKNYLNHLDIAIGSLEETKYHLLVAKDLNYIDQNDYCRLLDLSEDIGRLLNGLINSLRKK